MTNLQRWNIDCIDTDALIDEIRSEPSRDTFLLSLKPVEEYSLLEKYVYYISQFHFKKLGIEFDNNHHVEFWWKKEPHFNLHVDCDETIKNTKGEYIYPLLSCVTYLNDSIYPTFFTDITHEKYKYKDFEEESSISFIFPKKNTQVTFKGNTYHGTVKLEDTVNMSDRYIIAINLWDNNFSGKQYYSSNKSISIKNITPILSEILDIEEVFVENKLTFDFFEKLLYNKLYTINEFQDIDKTYSFYKIIDKQNDIKIKNIEKIKDFSEEINNIIESITFPDKLNPYNRFIQRFTYQSIYSKDICNWFINESEQYALNNGGWNEYRHINYPTVDLPLKNIPAIYKYFVFSLQTILKKIEKMYNIPEDYTMNITDSFIIKYKSNQQNELEFHLDGSILSFNILLSDENTFEGGGTQFLDTLQIQSTQGDLIVHCGKIKHSGGKITNGTRYILTCFIDLIFSEV
jgi:hypothetical protein